METLKDPERSSQDEVHVIAARIIAARKELEAKALVTLAEIQTLENAAQILLEQYFDPTTHKINKRQQTPEEMLNIGIAVGTLIRIVQELRIEVDRK